jgi:hypothetical protein
MFSIRLLIIAIVITLTLTLRISSAFHKLPSPRYVRAVDFENQSENKVQILVTFGSDAKQLYSL